MHQTESMPANNNATGVEPAPSTTMIDGETLPIRTDSEVADFDTIDALSRLVVGGAVDISELLAKLLEHWESEIAERHEATIVENEEDLGDILRYLIVGMIFEGQHAVRGATKSAGSLMAGAIGFSVSVSKPIRNSWLFSPLRRTTNAVTERLEDRIADLVRTGRSEEFVGRLMAEGALAETVDWVMEYFAHDPQIRELVQQQALGFSEEITIGTRERTITADNAFDTLLRKILRRTPRKDLPGPPVEVQRLEESFNQRERINQA